MASRRAFLLGVGAFVASSGVSRGKETTATRSSRRTNEATPPTLAASDRFVIGDISYATLAEALRVLKDGQTLDIAPGKHSGEAGYSRASNITISAGGEA